MVNGIKANITISFSPKLALNISCRFELFVNMCDVGSCGSLLIMYSIKNGIIMANRIMIIILTNNILFLDLFIFYDSNSHFL